MLIQLVNSLINENANPGVLYKSSCDQSLFNLEIFEIRIQNAAFHRYLSRHFAEIDLSYETFNFQINLIDYKSTKEVLSLSTLRK